MSESLFGYPVALSIDRDLFRDAKRDDTGAWDLEDGVFSNGDHPSLLYLLGLILLDEGSILWIEGRLIIASFDCMTKIIQSPFLRVFEVVLETVLSTDSAQGDELLPVNVMVKEGFQVS